MTNNNSYDTFKKYRVNDVNSVAEFLDKYYKTDRYYSRDKYFPELENGYSGYLLNNYEQEFRKNGFCFILHHDSRTGDIVAFYG